MTFCRRAQTLILACGLIAILEPHSAARAQPPKKPAAKAPGETAKVGWLLRFSASGVAEPAQKKPDDKKLLPTRPAFSFSSRKMLAVGKDGLIAFERRIHLVI